MSTQSSEEGSLQSAVSYKMHDPTKVFVRLTFCSVAGTVAVIPGVLTLLEQSSLQRMSIGAYIPLLASRLYWQSVVRALPPTAIVSTQKSAALATAPEVSKQLNTLANKTDDIPISASTQFWINSAISGGLALGERAITTPKNNDRMRAAMNLDRKLTSEYTGNNMVYARGRFGYLGLSNLLVRSGVKYGAILTMQPLMDKWIYEYIPYSEVSMPVSIFAATAIKVGSTLPFEMAQVKRLEYCHQHKTVFKVPSSGHFMSAIWRQQGFSGLMQGWRGNSLTTAILYSSIACSEAAVRKAESLMISSSFFQQTPLVKKEVVSPSSPTPGIM
jgi:hypothetical protein